MGAVRPLVRDVGGLYLALGVLVVAALVTLSRPLILTAAAATSVSAVPHAIYHMVNRDGLGTGDLVISLSGLVLLAAIPLALIAMWRRPTTA